MLADCHVELRSWCSNESQVTGLICLHDNDTEPDQSLDECGIHVTLIDMNTCTSANKTTFPPTNGSSLVPDVDRFIGTLPVGTVIAAVSSCGVRKSKIGRILSFLHVLQGDDDNEEVKFALITQLGYPAKTLVVADTCGTSTMQLCVDIRGNSS